MKLDSIKVGKLCIGQMKKKLRKQLSKKLNNDTKDVDSRIPYVVNDNLWDLL